MKDISRIPRKSEKANASTNDNEGDIFSYSTEGTGGATGSTGDPPGDDGETKESDDDEGVVDMKDNSPPLAA
jgi:hypothetical protein